MVFHFLFLHIFMSSFHLSNCPLYVIWFHMCCCWPCSPILHEPAWSRRTLLQHLFLQCVLFTTTSSVVCSNSFDFQRQKPETSLDLPLSLEAESSTSLVATSTECLHLDFTSSDGSKVWLKLSWKRILIETQILLMKEI